MFGANAFSRVGNIGWMGVDLFFVLSGFFIGGQLWKEIGRDGTVDIRSFVLRRGFRIWPLYYFMFVATFTRHLILGQSMAAKQYGWSDLVFLTNYLNHGLVNGSWSLCTEEHFYLVAPVLLFLSVPFLKQVHRFRPYLWILLWVVPLIRIAVYVSHTGSFFVHSPWGFSLLYYPSYTHCDGLIAGMIVSNCWVSRKSPLFSLSSKWVLLIAIVVSAGLYWLQKEIFVFTLLGLVFGATVWFGIQNRVSIFDSRLFYWISRLSFGMYLNHEDMCPWVVQNILAKLCFVQRFPATTNILGFLLMSCISACVALVTFSLIEYPFLQMRKRVLSKPGK
jgi:peptidoglycan/LPS O-acetylase OafA/YrhL